MWSVYGENVSRRGHFRLGPIRVIEIASGIGCSIKTTMSELRDVVFDADSESKMCRIVCQ